MAAKVGLVLSGGGAKGAYQVGVARALAEAGVEVDVVSGASIGALNGAILAAAPDMETAAERLAEVWMSLVDRSPLHPDVPAILLLLGNIGGVMAAPGRVAMGVLAGLSTAFDLPGQGEATRGLLSDAPLRTMLEKFLDLDSLAKRRPLHVSVYASKSVVLDLIAAAGAVAGLRDTGLSEFKLLQSLPREEQMECLMASAALPAIFKRRRLGAVKYSDGGQGGWMTAQGNTPVAPLIAEKCDVILVSHLSNGSFWRPDSVPSGAAFVDLRPKSPISRSVTDMLGFDAERIPRWIDLGYEETLKTLSSIKSAISGVREANVAKQALENELDLLDADMAALYASMPRPPN